MTGWETMNKFWEVLHIYRRIMRNTVTIKRVEKLLAVENTMPNNPEAQTLSGERFDFLCDTLSFQYEGREAPILHELSLALPAGKMYAFVGRSGAGKSTLVKMLQRVYDPTGGCVRLNGVDIRDVSRDWFRSLFAYVAQNVLVFDTTIKENVRYGVPKATDEEVKRALFAAHLAVVFEDPKRFPKGMEEEAGENGVALSGGECQRIGLARAYLKLMHGAKFLVLDEATSSLDSESEDAIRAMIEDIRREEGRVITIFAIAHRLSTIRSADCIFFLEEGRMIESGTHEELVHLGTRYADAVSRQSLLSEASEIVIA